LNPCSKGVVYALGHLAEQTDGSGTILASFTDDTTGTPTSVVLGDPNSGPRYDYAYDAQGNVVNVTDRSGTVVASYAYDAFGALVSSSESFPNGWSNPFRYDGAQGVRYDAETGLYWMSVRAYDPTLGRFLSRDPLGRLAAMGLDMQPYAYAGNNPVNYSDPSGMLFISGPSGEIATPAPSGGCGRFCPDSTGGSGKYTFTVNCGRLHPGDSYYNDPHCKAWRIWYNEEAQKQRTHVTGMIDDAANQYIAGGAMALVGDLALIAADPILEKPFDFLLALTSVDYILHGMALKGNSSLDWVAGIVTGGLHLFAGVARFIQAYAHVVFMAWLLDATLAATPFGMFLTVLRGIALIVAPLISGLGHIALGIAYTEEAEANKQKSMTVEAWAAEYDPRSWLGAPAESFDVTA
jgi:RHS repeat-associated protein